MSPAALLLRMRWCLAALAPCGALPCATDRPLGPVAAAPWKGIGLDDAALRWCPSQAPGSWPAAAALRLARAWDARWGEASREAAWREAVGHTRRAGAKVVLVSPISCEERADDAAWAWTKSLALALGPAALLGVVLGDDLDTLPCLWGHGRLWRQFQRYVAELDASGLAAVRVSSALSAGAVHGEAWARAQGFLESAAAAHGARFAFSWRLRPGCGEEARAAWGERRAALETLRRARARMEALTGRRDAPLWALATGRPSSGCAAGAAAEASEAFYRGFLNWDLGIGGGGRPVDYAFWSAAHSADDDAAAACACTSPSGGRGKFACGDVALFSGWVAGGRRACERRCELDDRCQFFGVWPISLGGRSWCRLTSTCRDVRPEVVQVSTFRKRPGAVAEDAGATAPRALSAAAAPDAAPDNGTDGAANASASVATDIDWLRQRLDEDTRSRSAGPRGAGALLLSLLALACPR